MKLAFVEMAGFRGFKDKTRFDLPAGFAVLTGRNGVGKSTVLDAVDFAITGTINKFAVKDAKGGGLNDHIWWVGEGQPESHYVAIGLRDDAGDEFVISRSRERGLEAGEGELARRLCHIGSPAQGWSGTLMQTTLVRDETIAALSLDLPQQARFATLRAAIAGLAGPDHTRRTKLLLESATAARRAQERRVADAQGELGRALGSLTEARSLAERDADVTEAQRIVAVHAPDVAKTGPERVAALRKQIVERKHALVVLAEALDRADRLQEERLSLESAAGLADLHDARAAYLAARQAKDQADKNLVVAQRLDARERERDALTSRMLALLDNGEALGLQDGHCPLCRTVLSHVDFARAIAAGRSSLAGPGVEAARLVANLEEARLAVGQADTALSIANQRLQELEARQSRLLRETQSLAAVLAQLNMAAAATDPDTVRRLLLEKQEDTARLEHALFILEASSVHDRVTAVEGRVDQLRSQLQDETTKLASLERAVENTRLIDNAAREVPNQVLTEQFDTVMPLLKELYQRLRPHTDWREIEIDFGGRVRASLNFIVGDGRNPQFLFSSGQRRAAGIAFLLALHLSRPWARLHSLLLDDPVQHIDDYRALNLVEVLSAVRRSGRQVIVAVEDTALADVLCRRLRGTALQPGRRFDLTTARNGSAAIERQDDIFPLPRDTLRPASA